MATSRQSGTLVGTRLGKYDLLALLALGGTAEIYLARIGGEAGFEKYVVVKCLLDHLADDEEFVRMFLDEARLGAQLDHSNIVQTLELGKHGNRYYMVMEYLAGMSLAQLARKTMERVPGGMMPVNLALGLCAQVCAGLHYAHQRNAADGTKLNIVHRDISPQNLVVSFDGVLKIVDFGIAKADVRQTHTKSGTIKGKFAYMSPEQCLAKEIDRRTDIFALGVILHELLTGRRLFKRSTTYETYQAIVSGTCPTPSQVNHRLDPSMDEVVMMALSYDREQRYPTAESFGEALLQVLHKRGHAISNSDVRSFYEQHFAPELQDHALRMRALISGRSDNSNSNESMTWGGDDPFGDKQLASGDHAALPPRDARQGTKPQPQADSLARTASPADDDDDDEGAATRVELNPLDVIHRQQRGLSGEIDTGEVGIEAQTGVRSVPRARGKSEVLKDSGKATVSLGPGARDDANQKTHALPPHAERPTASVEPRAAGKLAAHRPTADRAEVEHRRRLAGAQPVSESSATAIQTRRDGDADTGQRTRLQEAAAGNGRAANPGPFGPPPSLSDSNRAKPPSPPDTLPGEDSVDEPAVQAAGRRGADIEPGGPTRPGHGAQTPPAPRAAYQPQGFGGGFADAGPGGALAAPTERDAEPMMARGPMPMPMAMGPGLAADAASRAEASHPDLTPGSIPQHPAARRPASSAPEAIPPGASRSLAPAMSEPAPSVPVPGDGPGTDEVPPIPLAHKPQAGLPLWLLFAAFVASVGVGMALTLLIGRML